MASLKTEELYLQQNNIKGSQIWKIARNAFRKDLERYCHITTSALKTSKVLKTKPIDVTVVNFCLPDRKINSPQASWLPYFLNPDNLYN
jgi:hypothetical protein